MALLHKLATGLLKPNLLRPVTTLDGRLDFRRFDSSEPARKQVDEGRPDDLYRYLWIKCAGHEVSVLDSYEQFMKMAAENLNISYVRTEEPLRYIKRRTLLASRHVHKKYRVQYEWRTYYRNLLFKNLTGSTLDTYLEYIERNVPAGVLLIAEKHRLAELPFDLNEQGEENKVES